MTQSFYKCYSTGSFAVYRQVKLEGAIPYKHNLELLFEKKIYSQLTFVLKSALLRANALSKQTEMQTGMIYSDIIVTSIFVSFEIRRGAQNAML